MGYITVLGGGAWGTSIAKLLADKGYDTTIWVLEEEVARDINTKGENTVFLPGVQLPRTLKASTDLGAALPNTRFIVNVIPTQYTRSVIEKAVPHMVDNAIIVSASKGIENGTYMTVSTIIKSVTGRDIAVLSGPSFAAEVTKGQPTAVTLACADSNTALMLQEIFNTDYFRVYTHDDVLGVELGAALKNVMAVASGISDGLKLGNSARAALITRGLAEMTRLGEKMGANKHTFAGLSGLGDLVLTCSSPLSRNYTVGFKLGKGQTLKEILASTRSVAEGVHTAKAAYELSLKQGVEMPIVHQIYKVIYEDKPAAEAVRDLMTRSLKAEFN